MRGLFLSVEGTDGSGKSTQLKKIEAYLRDKGQRVFRTREPGGTEISEKIRELLLDPDNAAMTKRTEMLLYAAARAQHVQELIEPTLDKGINVLTDRFTDSSIAYQGGGREMGVVVAKVNHIATGGLQPDVTFFLDLPPEKGIARKIEESYHKLDRLEMEKLDFHKRVYDGYIHICNTQGHRICRIDASKSIDEMFLDIKNRLDLLFGFK